MNSLSIGHNWIGAQVLIDESANWIGWVKEIKPDQNNSNEIKIVVVPTRFRWFPKAMTGACEFSSNAVLISGEDCLVITNQGNIKNISQDIYFKRAIDSIVKIIQAIILLIAIPPILVFLPVFVCFLVIWASPKIYRKIFFRVSLKSPQVHPSKYGDEDENDDEGFSKMRQPLPRGPKPTDNIELEIPFIEDENPMELFPVIRLQ